MKWKDKLISDIIFLVKEQEWEASKLEYLLHNDAVNIHLAVFTEPYLSLIFSGKKTIESRFSVNRVVPYRKVFHEDIVLIKKSGADIIGFFIVKEVLYFSNLNENKIKAIEKQFGEELAWNADPEFLVNKLEANFLTLILIDKVVSLRPIASNKSDRAGWSIIKLGLNNTLFSN